MNDISRYPITDKSILQCQSAECGKLTTALEAKLRNFNEYRCGYCGFYLLPIYKDKDENEAE